MGCNLNWFLIYFFGIKYICQGIKNYSGNGKGNDYLYLAFLAQNDEGTVRERSRNDQKFFGNGQGTVTNKMVTDRERYRNEIITVLQFGIFLKRYFLIGIKFKKIRKLRIFC